MDQRPRIHVPSGLTLTDLIDAAGDDTVTFARRQAPLGAPITAHRTLDSALADHQRDSDSDRDALRRARARCWLIAADAATFDALARLAAERDDARHQALADAATAVA